MGVNQAMNFDCCTVLGPILHCIPGGMTSCFQVFFYAVVIIPFKGRLYNKSWEWLLFSNCLLTPVGNVRPSAALSGLTLYQNALSGALKNAACLTV
jgi:hypothetical protein